MKKYLKIAVQLGALVGITTLVSVGVVAGLVGYIPVCTVRGVWECASETHYRIRDEGVLAVFKDFGAGLKEAAKRALNGNLFN